MRHIKALLAIVLAGSFAAARAGEPVSAAPVLPRDIVRDANPEPGTGLSQLAGLRGQGWMAVTANAHATEAAASILRAGGSAVDAAIAAQMVLNLVEPQSSGIGGGGFLLLHDSAARRTEAWDGRETAPAAANGSLLLDQAGKPLGFSEAAVGGRTVGVPGLLGMLERVHLRHGRIAWARLFDPAIELSLKGFPVSPRLHALLESDPALRRDPQARALFYDESGRALPVGHLLRNPSLARTFAEIAAQGSRALHSGPLARAIVATVNGHPSNPGQIALGDLSGYRAVEREPVCIERARDRICGMPPPSAGGIAVGQILGIWESRRKGRTAGDPPNGLVDPAGSLDPQAVHYLAEAGRLAFADRDAWIADTDFSPLPAGPAAFVSPAYLAERARQIGERAMTGPATAGTPVPGARTDDLPIMAIDTEQAATTHLSIIDARGNAVSLTSSIESAFGARLMVGGFLLNHQLTDFSFEPTRDGKPVANRIEPGKRPRSSMAPTIVLDRQTGRVTAVIGSPGGPRIISYVAHALIAILDDGLDPQRAVSLPQFANRNGDTEIERSLMPDPLADALAGLGHRLRRIDTPSGLHVIRVACRDGTTPLDDCILFAGVDPRREGHAIAEHVWRKP